MRKLSITKKLFIITAFLFAIFIMSTLIIQTLFFQRFYISRKKSDLESNIIKFESDYDKAQSSTAITQLIDEYESSYNEKIIVMDKTGKSITNPPRNRNDLFKLRELAGFIDAWNSNPNNLDDLKKKNRIITVSNKSGVDVPGSIVSISYDKQNNSVVFALTSLQPVNEAVSVIEQLYFYFSLGAIIFTIILALIYSNMIAKPLLKINKVATKMAHLDFSEKCEVTSEDEIGNVAASLNFLSENLANALNSLRKANAELEKDIEKERKLERMRREFVASVSHELKTPISLIDGYAVGLKDNIFEGEDRDYYLDIISDEARKMAKLVSEMLDLSYLESGNFKLVREEFNITNLIKVTLKKYDALILEKKVKTQLSLLEKAEVFADWGRMEQVITNFITNAIRHVNDEGSISVNMIEKGEYISIEVENTGEGIPEEELSKLWDKFYKIDKSRNRKLGGTGIGLSIVKNILELHGYTYGVENVNNGVKFYFIIPKKYMAEDKKEGIQS